MDTSQLSLSSYFYVANEYGSPFSLFCFCGENYRVLLFPSVYNQSLSWENMSCKSNVYLLEKLRFILEKVLLNCSCCYTHKTKSMENRNIKAPHFRHVWVYVQRISVVAQSINCCLVFWSRLFRNHIRLTFGDFGEHILYFTLVSESTYSTDEKARSYNTLELFCSGFSNFCIKN